MTNNINEIRHNTKMAAEFFAQRLAYTLGPVELKKMLEDNKVKLIDVRRKEDYDEGHIEGAISMPKDELKERLSELSQSDVHAVYCYNQQCHLGAAAAFTLTTGGYPAMEIEGGYDVWVNGFGFKVVK